MHSRNALSPTLLTCLSLTKHSALHTGTASILFAVLLLGKKIVPLARRGWLWTLPGGRVAVLYPYPVHWRSGKSKSGKSGAKSVLKMLKNRNKREKLAPAARADSGTAPAGPAPGGLRRQRTEAARNIAASVSRGACCMAVAHRQASERIRTHRPVWKTGQGFGLDPHPRASLHAPCLVRLQERNAGAPRKNTCICSSTSAAGL